MTYHREPRDDAWRKVSLEHVAGLGRRIWLRCDQCARSVMAEPLDFGREHGLDPSTPLLTIAQRLRCRCGARKAHCWPEPYGIGDERSR